MHRSYIPTADFSQSTLIITDSHEVHHVKDVMRLSLGGRLQVFNAQGEIADVTIVSIADREIVVKVGGVKSVKASGVKIILACAIPKRVKFEEIIEKAVELGVDEIIPLQTARTEVIIKDDKSPAKMARFHKVAIAASKQCGLGFVPLVSPAMTLAQALSYLPPTSIKIFPSLHGHSVHIRQALLKVSSTDTVVIFIGPEGDFTPKEVDTAIKAGCQPVTLGATVLRVETAALSSVALARFLLRD